MDGASGEPVCFLCDHHLHASHVDVESKDAASISFQPRRHTVGKCEQADIQGLARAAGNRAVVAGRRFSRRPAESQSERRDIQHDADQRLFSIAECQKGTGDNNIVIVYSYHCWIVLKKLKLEIFWNKLAMVLNNQYFRCVSAVVDWYCFIECVSSLVAFWWVVVCCDIVAGGSHFLYHFPLHDCWVKTQVMNELSEMRTRINRGKIKLFTENIKHLTSFDGNAVLHIFVPILYYNRWQYWHSLPEIAYFLRKEFYCGN